MFYGLDARTNEIFAVDGTAALNSFRNKVTE